MTYAQAKLKIVGKVFMVPVVNVISSLIPEFAVLACLKDDILCILTTCRMKTFLYSFTEI